MSRPMYRLPLLVALSLLSIAGLAGDSRVNSAKSSMVVTFKQEGVPVEAPFTRFSGVINYDLKNVAASSASLEIDTGSLDIGDEGYNAEVRKKSWLDSATYPKASFKSTAIKADGPGKFTATGTLTMKGRVLALTVPVTTNSTGTSFDGSFTLSRKAFGIGDASWEGVLDDSVKVRFHLITTP